MIVFVQMLILSASVLVQNSLAPAQQSFSSFSEDAHVSKEFESISSASELARLCADVRLSSNYNDSREELELPASLQILRCDIASLSADAPLCNRLQ